MYFKLQYLSDIHLEYRKTYDINPCADNLVLCGDIGHLESIEYSNFIFKCSRLFKNVFVIFGNHEFYSDDQKTIKEIKESTKNYPSNIYFLDNDCVFVDLLTNEVKKQLNENDVKQDHIKLIGSTLWSDLMPQHCYYMNDFRYIYTEKNKPLTYSEYKNMYYLCLNYIVKQLDKDKDVATVLLTHHGPHPICNGRFQEKGVYSAFTSDIPSLYSKTNLLACISGHTHQSINGYKDFDNGNVIGFFSNQLGYPGEENTGFEENTVLEIPIITRTNKTADLHQEP